MRKLVLLCGAVLLSSVAAVAQNDISTVATPSPAAALPASPQAASRGDLPDWQISIGYQFNRFNMPSAKKGTYTMPAFTVDDHGYDVSLTRFFVSWAGLEADSAEGWGSASIPQITDAKSLFAGGGPHFALRGHGRVEPWVHALVGLEHFRFSQTSTVYGSNNSLGFIGGGGVDLHLNVRTAIRVQFDYLGTFLFSATQNNWQAGAGVVFNF
jgi:hypothetical protein